MSGPWKEGLLTERTSTLHFVDLAGVREGRLRSLLE